MKKIISQKSILTIFMTSYLKSVKNFLQKVEKLFFSWVISWKRYLARFFLACGKFWKNQVFQSLNLRRPYLWPQAMGLFRVKVRVKEIVLEFSVRVSLGIICDLGWTATWEFDKPIFMTIAWAVFQALNFEGEL